MNAALHQWFTPRWVCEAIVDRYYRFLDLADSVIEPSCGDGRFLGALPSEIQAVGVEIDPALAQRARESTGRQVITGDFLTAEIPGRFSHAIGNLPFDARLVHGFLARAHDLVEDGGECGFLLPAYVLQTSSKVMALHRSWSIQQELMPRNIFPRLSLPLVFARFRKEQHRTLVGFFLYQEAADVAKLPREVQAALQQPSKGSVWRHAVRAAFLRIGSARATLESLYAAVERPSENRFWREKVRQVLQTYPEFVRAGAGQWSVREAA